MGALVDAWYAGDRRLVDEATLIPMDLEEDGGDADESDEQRAVWLIAPVFDAGRAAIVRWRQDLPL